MAATKTKVTFSISPKKWGEEIYNETVEEQTRRLIEYAKKTVQNIGDKMHAFNSTNNLDRTGNLLRSLCWGVLFKGELKGSGFYEGAINGNGKESYLHEFSRNDSILVKGRTLAEEYIESQKNRKSGRGWKMFVAVLAPYWGYWEIGFNMNIGGNTIYRGKSGERKIPTVFRKRFRFNVMAETWDVVRMDLKPAKTDITVYVPKYIHKDGKWRKKLKKRVGVQRFGTQR